MSPRALCQHCLTKVAASLLVVPFVLMSLIAPGYMPTRAESGAMVMVICTSHGPMEMAIGGDADPAPKDGRCAWAQAAQAVVLTEAPPVPLPPRALPQTLVAATPDDLWHPAHDPRGLYARGPPPASA